MDFLSDIPLALETLENQPWPAFQRPLTYKNSTHPTKPLPPLTITKTTLKRSFAAVSSPASSLYLALKLLSLDLRSSDDQAFAASFRSINPYNQSLLQDYSTMTKTPHQQRNFDSLKLLEFHSKFEILQLFNSLYVTYFSQIRLAGTANIEAIFTVAAASKCRFRDVFSSFIRQNFAKNYKEFSQFQLQPPGKIINFFDCQEEKIHLKCDEMQQIDVPMVEYFSEVENVKIFVNSVQKHSGDIGVKLLILDNLDTSNDFYLSVHQSVNLFFQILIQISISISPGVVMSGGCSLIKIRELSTPAMASVLQVLSYFYEEICYFQGDFQRVLGLEKWVCCKGKKRVDRQLAVQISQQLIEISQKVKEFEIGVEIEDEFEFVSNLLPINQNLIEYVKKCNIKFFDDQSKILQQGLFYYARMYKNELLPKLINLIGDVNFTYQSQSITQQEYLDQYLQHNPEIGILFPSNEKREKMVYRYLEKINPEIQMIQDLKYVLQSGEPALSVRWNSQEIQQKTIKMVVVSTEKERNIKEKIERERKEKQERDEKERKKEEKKNLPAVQQQQQHIQAPMAMKNVVQKTVQKPVQHVQKPVQAATENSQNSSQNTEINKILSDVIRSQNVVPQIEKVKIEPPQKSLKGMKGKSILFAGKGKGMGIIEKKEEPKPQPKKNLLKNVRKQM